MTLSYPIQYLIVIFCAFVVSTITFPSIIFVSKQRNLFDDHHLHRKDHKNLISRLGGVGIFCSFMVTTLLVLPQHASIPINYLQAACIILFAMGIKDDIVSVNASTKFISQFVTSLLLVIPGEVRLSGFYGIFGIFDLPVFGQIILSIMVIMLLINAFNLIDGINTLASGMGIMASGIYGIMFMLMSQPELASLSFALMGALLGFIRYNWSPAKLFMGDTGSMLIGCIIAVLTIKYIDVFFQNSQVVTYRPESAPAFTIAILLIPIYDTLRVFVLRISKGNSPFHADQNHLHHLLTSAGLKHEETALVLIGLNTFAIFLVVMLDKMSNLFLISLLACICVLFSSLLQLIKSRKLVKFLPGRVLFGKLSFLKLVLKSFINF